MARQPEVFVRELDPAEAQRLVKITRTARDRVRLRRAGIVLASMQGRSPAEAAGMLAATVQYAREVIHAFNTQGFAALDPKWSGGRPRKFGSVAREIVCRVAKTAPQQAGSHEERRPRSHIASTSLPHSGMGPRAPNPARSNALDRRPWPSRGEAPTTHPDLRSRPATTWAWMASVRSWIWRVSSVLRCSSCSCATKSWSAFACWNAAWRFWPIITKVDKKIASRETTRVSVGHGDRSRNSIQTANNMAWM